MVSMKKVNQRVSEWLDNPGPNDPGSVGKPNVTRAQHREMKRYARQQVADEENPISESIVKHGRKEKGYMHYLKEENSRTKVDHPYGDEKHGEGPAKTLNRLGANKNYRS